MKTVAKFWVGLVLVGSGFSVWAQMSPDVVWTTNAHYDLHGVGISGDSRFIVSAGQDQTIKIWNTTNTALVRTLTISGGAPLAVALSSNGSQVTAGDGSGKTRVWRVSDGVRVWLGGPDDEQVHAVSFSSDDALLGMGRSDGLYVCCGILFEQPANNQVFDIRFSPDSQRLASANENFTASLWRIPEGTLVHDFIGHSNIVNSVDFSADGKLLATASADGTARIWSVTNGAPLLVINGGGGVAKFSADGRLLYTLDNYTFKIWRVSNGTCAGSILGTGAIKFDIAKNGKFLVYGTSGDVSALILARPPLVIDEFSRVGNETILHWQGGTGFYQLLSSTNLTNWQNIGSATTNQFATNLNSATLFFRVQSLPNP